MNRIANWFEITQIRLENIRGFRDLSLDLRQQGGRPRKRTLIIGKNGTCKTTLLRAIAIGLADQTDGSRMISEPLGGFVGEKSDKAQVNLWGYTTPDRIVEANFRQILKRVENKESLEVPSTLASLDPRSFLPAPFLCGYGAGRFGSGTDTRLDYRIADAVGTLFRYQETLSNPELTLRRLESSFGTEIYTRTMQGIKRALGLSDAESISFLPLGGVVVSGPKIGAQVLLEGWADGYRLTFSWILDLYAWALRAGSIDEEGHIEGILLIDEIEQHLHPSMQAEILPRLSELLPKMQIFATTHSPLVALDARPEELVVLRREGDHVVAEPNVPDFSGYSAEDMLSDPRLFDTEVYGSETREKLSEYRGLAAIPKEERNPEQRRQLRSLAFEINSMEKPGERDNETSRLLKQLMAKYDL